MQPNLIPLPASEDRGNILAKINLRDLYCIMHDGLCRMHNVKLITKYSNPIAGGARYFTVPASQAVGSGLGLFG